MGKEKTTKSAKLKALTEKIANHTPVPVPVQLKKMLENQN